MNCSTSHSTPVVLLLMVGVSLLLLSPRVTAQEDYAPWPQPGSGYVTDLADVLTDSEEERIEQWLIRVEESEQVEIIVVTIHSISSFVGTDNRSIEAFATGLFNRWGVGNLPRNDGILLLIAVGDRKARIELGSGYPRSRDADANRIIQEMILPEFRKGDYGKGITEGVRSIIETFTTLHVGFRWELVMIPIAIVVLVLIGMSLLKNGKRGWGWVFIGLAFILLLLFLYLLVILMRSSRRYGHSSGWSAGGSGGFGGGFSSGGGASGSW